MSQFVVRPPDQLPSLLQAFREEAGLTQEEVALRLGVSLQSWTFEARRLTQQG